MPSFKARPQSGFTLIELLMVMVLVPVVGFAVFSNFRSGADLWRGLQREVPEERQAVFEHRLSSDIQNMLRHAKIRFVGTPEEMTFCTVIQGPEALGGQDAIGQVRYRFDGTARVLVREEKDVHQVHKERPGRVSSLLAGVASLEFSYLVRDEQKKTFGWVESFEVPDKDTLPAAVKIVYASEQDGQLKNYEVVVQPGAWG